MVTGMLEAESMSFWRLALVSDCACVFEASWQDSTYPVGRLNLALGNGLHDAPLLVGHVTHPVRLTRRDEQVRGKAIDVPV